MICEYATEMTSTVTAVAAASATARYQCSPSARNASSTVGEDDSPSAPSPTHARNATSEMWWYVFGSRKFRGRRRGPGACGASAARRRRLRLRWLLERAGVGVVHACAPGTTRATQLETCGRSSRRSAAADEGDRGGVAGGAFVRGPPGRVREHRQCVRQKQEPHQGDVAPGDRALKGWGRCSGRGEAREPSWWTACRGPDQAGSTIGAAASRRRQDGRAHPPGRARRSVMFVFKAHAPHVRDPPSVVDDGDVPIDVRGNRSLSTTSRRLRGRSPWSRSRRSPPPQGARSSRCRTSRCCSCSASPSWP